MTTVIGVDPSLAATGLAVWRDGRLWVRTCYTFAGDPAEKRWAKIVADIYRCILGPTLVVMEGRIDIAPKAELIDGKAKVTGGRRGASTLDLAELRGVIRYGIAARERPRVDVHPGTLKHYATGDGRASKQEMLLAAERRLGRLVSCRDHNQSDALWLAAMALHHYGRPLCSMPAKNSESLTKVDWPEFRLDGEL